MKTEATQSVRCRAPGGWSLIELLVVVSIIAILLAILINTAAEGRGPLESTKVTLQALKAIFDEFEVSTKQVPTAIGGSTDSIENFCTKVNTLSRTRDMLFNLGKDAALDIQNDKGQKVSDGRIDTVKDGWGTVIRYSDGTPDVANGMPGYRTPYFASAGPDAKWGTVNAGNNELLNEAKDNLYSFQLGN